MARVRTWMVGVAITAALSYIALTWWRRSSTPKPPKRRGTRKSRDTWKDVEVDKDKKKRKLSTDEGAVHEQETSTTSETQQTTNDNDTTTETSTSHDTSQIIPASSPQADKSPIFYDLLKLYAGVDQQPSSSRAPIHATSSPLLSSSSSYPRGTSLSESIVSMAPLAPSASRRAAIPVPVIPFATTSHLHPHAHAHSRGPPRAHASLSDGAISSSDDTHMQADGEESTGEESDITPLRSARLRRMRRARVVSPRRSRGSIIPHTNSLVSSSSSSSSSTSTRTRKSSSSFPRSNPHNNNK